MFPILTYMRSREHSYTVIVYVMMLYVYAMGEKVWSNCASGYRMFWGSHESNGVDAIDRYHKF